MSMIPMYVVMSRKRRGVSHGSSCLADNTGKSKFDTVMTIITIASVIMMLATITMLIVSVVQDKNSAKPVEFQSEIIKVGNSSVTIKNPAYYAIINDYNGEERRVRLSRKQYDQLKDHAGETVTVNAEISWNFIDKERTVNHEFTLE